METALNQTFVLLVFAFILAQMLTLSLAPL